ncbi:glycosyltransferase, partial [Patescibacteria group bacterium]|nr:glycosyltransferase [Patescibacteria group bacterium]
MRLLWFSSKDIKNPKAGGAETIKHELAKRLVKNGHRVTFLASKFKGALPEEKIDGYNVIRIGSQWSIYRKARKYYENYLKKKFDIVIDEVHPIPFFAKKYVKEKNILFIHQLNRDTWFYKFYFPLSFIAYLYEMFYLRQLRDKKVVTVSESTKRDLLNFKFPSQNISVISVGVELEPIKFLSENDKFQAPTILSLG